MPAPQLALARSYARALFEAVSGGATAGSAGAAAKALAELNEAARELPARLAALQHPGASAARRQALLREAAGAGISPKTARLLDLLARKKRLSLVPLVAAEFGRLLDEKNGVARAAVRAASELSPEASERLRRGLGVFSGKTVVMTVQTDPELLAGVVVRMGDWVIDGSLQGRLRRLGSHLARSA